jgi:hypothetical protein
MSDLETAHVRNMIRDMMVIINQEFMYEVDYVWHGVNNPVRGLVSPIYNGIQFEDVES